MRGSFFYADAQEMQVGRYARPRYPDAVESFGYAIGKSNLQEHRNLADDLDIDSAGYDSRVLDRHESSLMVGKST
jgi:hypothetical protein